ncbi:hypothetical protein DYU05_18635 [Mucilaginibacter terrenus]|uniref:Uncharacterized protein n=1 Tax=Mucilaginibacter terrenus TaxID=2482727 RepID=A0A3E2NLI8_9SPHI|nr:hypothetical protein DYU05_18635 [Mucilaginibacter terrenus]
MNNIKAIDDYLLNRLAPADALLFEANTLLNVDLAADVKHQQNTHSMVREYGRQAIKAEIIAVQKTLAEAPQHRNFMQRIAHLFKK